MICFLLLQSAQPISWPSFWMEAVKILGPAIVALLGTFIALYHQRRLKTVELDALTRLKARELMFGDYQRKMEQNIRDVQALGKTMAELEMALSLSDDELEKKKMLVAFVGSMNQIMSALSTNLDDLEVNLKSVNLHAKHKPKIDFIKKHFDPANTTPSYISRNHKTITEALAYMVSMQQELIEKKREELFREYLPKTN